VLHQLVSEFRLLSMNGEEQPSGRHKRDVRAHGDST
jgi:hypothetical protein